MIKTERGAVLAIVLLSISVMAMMMYVLSQIIVNQQRSVNNYADIKLAENYARTAMLSAESRVYYFDSGQYSMAGISIADNTLYNFESSTASCCSVGVGSEAYRRYLLLKNMAGDVAVSGVNCNSATSFKGICYSQINSSLGTSINYNSDQAWQPWLIESSGTVKPCSSYSKNDVPLIDDKTYRYSWRYVTNDTRLCTDPRMMVEPINLAYRGSYRVESGVESDYMRQANGAVMTTYKEDGVNSIPSARLYRITVVAFGRNGDTKVTLQETILINNYAGNTASKMRVAGESAVNLSNRIVRLSTHWLN